MIKLMPDALMITKPVFNFPSFSSFFEKHTNLKPVEALDPNELTNFNHCDIIPMMAGKTCYLSFEKDKGRNRSRDHIGNLLDSKHGSVLEHTNVGFILLTSRDISHEIVRHRMASYSQLSQRYVNFPQFLIPPELHSYILNKNSFINEGLPYELDDVGVIRTPELSPLDLFIKNCISSEQEYQNLASKLEQDLAYSGSSKTEKRKIVNQTARSILPNATVTYIFMTANLRSWRHICEQRCSKHAATGIRWLFNKVFDQLIEAAPACFQDYTRNYLPDGSFEIKTSNTKV